MPLPCGCRADEMCPDNSLRDRAANIPSPPPSVGRIVHYHRAFELPKTDGEGTVITAGVPLAAMVTALRTDTGRIVDLTLFGPCEEPRPLGDVPHSVEPAPGHWSWPPRV